MDGRRACLVDAFTDAPYAGNAAGVVPEADDLSAAQMQAIATELSASETAFLSASDDANRRIRFFTPTQEVDLCGHATIASHALLAADGAITPGAHTLETKVGVLDIELQDDGVVWMTQSRPEVETSKSPTTDSPTRSESIPRDSGMSGLTCRSHGRRLACRISSSRSISSKHSAACGRICRQSKPSPTSTTPLASTPSPSTPSNPSRHCTRGCSRPARASTRTLSPARRAVPAARISTATRPLTPCRTTSGSSRATSSTAAGSSTSTSASTIAAASR